MPIKYAHVNLVAKNWKNLAIFYQNIFQCEPILPERDLSGTWLEKATGIPGAQIMGVHLRLPGFGNDGPTLEIFEYGFMVESPIIKPNTPGFSHIAFAVDDVVMTVQAVVEAGGTEVGTLTVREITGVGVVTFQYVTDPEGNIIEIQHWDYFRNVE